MGSVIQVGDWLIASARHVWTPEELACAREAADLLESAAARGREIIAKAEAEGERIRAAAQAEGYRVGEAQALRRVLARLGGQEHLISSAREFLIQSVSSCTESLLATELSALRYRNLLELVDRTLAGWTWLTLRVAPDSLEEAAAVVSTIQGAITERVAVVADETLRPGECVIESDAGWLDGRLDTSLSQVRAALADMLAPSAAGGASVEP